MVPSQGTRSEGLQLRAEQRRVHIASRRADGSFSLPLPLHRTRTNITSFVETRRCAALNVTDQMCTNVRVPLNGMARSLGIPLGIQGKEYQWGNDAVEMYGYVFLWLTACMGIMVMVHDLALLSPTWKDSFPTPPQSSALEEPRRFCPSWQRRIAQSALRHQQVSLRSDTRYESV